MLIELLEDYVGGTQWSDFHGFTPELTLDVGVTIPDEIRTFSVTSTDRRVMADLLRNEFVAAIWSKELVGLTKNGIEGFLVSVDG